MTTFSPKFITQPSNKICLLVTKQTDQVIKTPAHTINVQTVTDGISRRVTSGRENTSLIFVDSRIEVSEGCYRNVILR